MRPGARFECHGDGLCCTDVHAIGPLSRGEARRLRVLASDAVYRDDVVESVVLRPGEDGTCVFLGDGRCELHARFGAATKPRACRRFPFGLTATPAGGRVTTAHRCPCRTLGERASLDAPAALEVLSERGFPAEHRVGGRVALAPRRHVSFERWTEIEAELLARLASGERPETVLDADPLPRRSVGSWEQVAHDLTIDDPETRFEHAVVWFAGSLRAIAGARRGPAPAQPWSDVFDRAEARTAAVASDDPIFADWIADLIWGMRWTAHGSFARARSEQATLLAIARDLAARLRRRGARRDRAAAEAVMIAETTMLSSAWLHAAAGIHP